MLTKNQIIFSSLVGSKVAESIPRFQLFENEVAKHVLPPIPFLPNQNEVTIDQESASLNGDVLWAADESNISKHFFPLSFRSNNPNNTSLQWFTFPYEPLLSIQGKNNIVRRSVAKAKDFVGTIKERWSQDDYEVTITGSIYGKQEIGAVQDCFPISDFEKLRDYCTDPYGIQVKCEPLQLLGIDYLVVESFNFPFTKGENVQAYELKCFSDFAVNYLLELE